MGALASAIEAPRGTSVTTNIGVSKVVGRQSVGADGRGGAALVKVEARLLAVTGTVGTSGLGTRFRGTAADVVIVLESVLVGHGGGRSAVRVGEVVVGSTSRTALAVAIKG